MQSVGHKFFGQADVHYRLNLIKLPIGSSRYDIRLLVKRTWVGNLGDEVVPWYDAGMVAKSTWIIDLI